MANGRLRAGLGGGTLELPGIRLMSSGIPVPQWNVGVVTDPGAVDLETVRAWYAARDVPWGVAVPAGTDWPHGPHVVTQRTMAAPAAEVRTPAVPAGVEVRVAGVADLEAYARVDAAAFDEDDPGLTRAWAAPMLGAAGFCPALALLDAEPVGVAHAVRSSGAGGESVGVFGVGVLPAARRRGIASALTAFVVRWGVAQGADLAWLSPDTEAAARLYVGLGFEETTGIDIHRGS